MCFLQFSPISNLFQELIPFFNAYFTWPLLSKYLDCVDKSPGILLKGSDCSLIVYFHIF